jgi:hypothetical protein
VRACIRVPAPAGHYPSEGTSPHPSGGRPARNRMESAFDSSESIT